jgi:hypothetical protein
VVASAALDARAWHVAWQEGPPDAAGVAYSRRYDAGWGQIESLARVSSGPPKVLAAPGGGREVVWLAEAAVWSARGFGEGAWETKVPAEDSTSCRRSGTRGRTTWCGQNLRQVRATPRIRLRSRNSAATMPS